MLVDNFEEGHTSKGLEWVGLRKTQHSRGGTEILFKDSVAGACLGYLHVEQF